MKSPVPDIPEENSKADALENGPDAGKYSHLGTVASEK